MKWNLFSECWGNPIIDDVYNQNLPPNNYYKGFGKLVERINKAKRKDVKPGEFIQSLRIAKTDCRKNVLENIAKYEADMFRIISIDWSRNIVIPGDRKMIVGLDDDWRGIHIRTNYIGAVITYGIENPKPHLEIHPYKSKDETEQQHKNNLECDIKLINRFLGKY